MIFTISIKFLKRKFDNKLNDMHKKGKDKIQFDENKKCNFIVLKPLESISFFGGGNFLLSLNLIFFLYGKS